MYKTVFKWTQIHFLVFVTCTFCSKTNRIWPSDIHTNKCTFCNQNSPQTKFSILYILKSGLSSNEIPEVRTRSDGRERTIIKFDDAFINQLQPNIIRSASMQFWVVFTISEPVIHCTGLLQLLGPHEFYSPSPGLQPNSITMVIKRGLFGDQERKIPAPARL